MEGDEVVTPRLAGDSRVVAMPLVAGATVLAAGTARPRPRVTSAATAPDAPRSRVSAWIMLTLDMELLSLWAGTQFDCTLAFAHGTIRVFGVRPSLRFRRT